MTVYCIAYNCPSRKREKGVGFHRFPHEKPKLLKLWLAKLKWKDWTPGLNSLICSKHFESKYLNLHGARPRLLPGAVPTIFDFPENINKAPRKPSINPRSRRATTDPSSLKSLDDIPKKRNLPPWASKEVTVATSYHPSHQLQPQQPKPQAGSSQLHCPQVGSSQHNLQAASSSQPQPLAGSSQHHLQAGSSLYSSLVPQAIAWFACPVVTTLQAASLPQQQPQAGSSQHHLQAGSSLPHIQAGSSQHHIQAGSSELQQPESQPDPPATSFVLISWTIQGDADMPKIKTLPSFFHGDYCIPQSFQWSGDAEANFEPVLTEKSELTTLPHIIKITGRWQWLGLDFRGPLPKTVNGDEFLLTITDYHSKWVEAFPVGSIVSLESAGILCDVFAQFGYPFGVLSRLRNYSISDLNKMFQRQLNRRGMPYDGQLIVYHRQTPYLDPETERRINSMLTELVNEHPDTWNVHLPGCVLRLCCSEHPDIGTSPFARMCPKDPKPITTPRDLPFSLAIVEDSSFVIDFSEKPDQDQEQSAATPMTDTDIFGDMAGEGTSNGEGGSNEEEQSR